MDAACAGGLPPPERGEAGSSKGGQSRVSTAPLERAALGVSVAIGDEERAACVYVRATFASASSCRDRPTRSVCRLFAALGLALLCAAPRTRRRNPGLSAVRSGHSNPSSQLHLLHARGRSGDATRHHRIRVGDAVHLELLLCCLGLALLLLALLRLLLLLARRCCLLRRRLRTRLRGPRQPGVGGTPARLVSMLRLRTGTTHPCLLLLQLLEALLLGEQRRVLHLRPHPRAPLARSAPSDQTLRQAALPQPLPSLLSPPRSGSR